MDFFEKNETVLTRHTSLHTMHNQRTWIELSSDAFFHNITQIKRIVGNTSIAVVLKANAYGHGLIEMGILADQTSHIQFICVAFLSEALLLRNARVKKPIIVLAYSDADIALSINQQISFVVDSHEQVHMLHRVALKYQTTFDIHIKIETGLNRRGIDSSSSASFIALVQQLSTIKIVGICSHFSSAYDNQITTYNQMQLFLLTLRNLSNHNIHIPLIHISNSSLTIIPECNLIRTGIAAYGYTPTSFGIPFRPVLTLKTRIIQIKEVPADSYVGYDGLYRTTRPTKLAIIPFGYVDGYDTRFTNKGVMYVKGHYAPVCGRVAMNVTSIDVTDIPSISIDDEVIVLGDIDGMRAFDLCAHAGIRNIRELLTRINPTLPKIIV